MFLRFLFSAYNVLVKRPLKRFCANITKTRYISFYNIGNKEEVSHSDIKLWFTLKLDPKYLKLVLFYSSRDQDNNPLYLHPFQPGIKICL